MKNEVKVLKDFIGKKYDILSFDKGWVKSINPEVSVSLKADVNKDFFGSVDIPSLQKILKVNYKTIVDGGSKFTFSNGRSDLSINKIEDFDMFDWVEECNNDLFEIDSKEFISIIEKVKDKMAKDKLKPVFCATCFTKSENNKLVVVTSDSRRLSCVTTNIDVDFEENGYLIPSEVILAMYKNRKVILTNNKISIYKNDSYSTQIEFEMDNMVIISRVIDGTFPNYNQVIPKEFKSKVEINKDQLTKDFTTAKEFSIAPTYKTIMDFGSKNLGIFSEQGSINFKSSISIENSYLVRFGINASYILDALKYMNVDFNNNIEVRLLGDMSPVIISPVKDDSYVEVIMPIMIAPKED